MLLASEEEINEEKIYDLLNLVCSNYNVGIIYVNNFYICMLLKPAPRT